MDSHLTKTNKANPNPTITQHPGRGGGRGLARGRRPPPPPGGRALRAAAPQPLTPPGAPPAPALPASFCAELESPPPRPLGPPQPAHPLPCAPTPQGRCLPEGERAGAASLPPSAHFSPQLSAPSGPRSPGGEGRRGEGVPRPPHPPGRLRPPPPARRPLPSAPALTPSPAAEAAPVNRHCHHQLIRAGRGQACHWRRRTAAIENAPGGEADLPAPTTEPRELERLTFRRGRGAPPFIGKRRAIARLGQRRCLGGHLGCGPARKRDKAPAAIFVAGGSSASQRVTCAGSWLSSFHQSHTVKNSFSLTLRC